MIITSKSEQNTQDCARDLASQLKNHETLCLYGNLGVGKTVFTRALIRAVSEDPNLNVPSPTFSLVQEYEIPRGALFHFDFYRLEDPEEIYELGWEDILGQAITIIEWPEKIAPLLPRKRLDITITNVENEPSHREIHIEYKE